MNHLSTHPPTLPVQAEKKKEEGVNEAKHNFEREQGNMRQEVDQELSKIRYSGNMEPF